MVNIKVDVTRISRHLDALAVLGATPEGGVTRLSYSSLERSAHQYVADRMADVGIEVSVDAAGNTIGILPGTERALAPILTGSHLDTVINGGRYDGVVGVVAGLEALHAIKNAGMTPSHSMGLLIFAGEEGGTRFGIGRLGSQIKTGHIMAEDLRSLTDKEGVNLEGEMKALGLFPERISEAVLKKGDVAAFLEVHIEQGDVLEKLGKPIGIVQAIVSATRVLIDIKGRADHAGGTPMKERKDALLAAAKMIVAFHSIIRNEGGSHTVGNVGDISVSPGSVTTVPARATMLIEVRDIVAATKNQMRDRLLAEFDRLSHLNRVETELKILTDPDPAVIPEWIQSLLIEACRERGVSYHSMPSAGGHDASYMAEIAPTGMIFVPSRGGLSHQPTEYTALEDITKGSEVLAYGMLKLDRHLDAVEKAPKRI